MQALGGTGVAVALAGCGGRQAAPDPSSNGGSNGGSGSNDGEVRHDGKPMDAALTLAQWAVPKDSQYNPYNGKNYAEPRRVLYDRFMEYNIAKGEFTGYAVQDWSFDGNALSLTLRDGLKWHDGDDVTSQDLVTQLKLDMYNGGTLKDYVEDVSTAVTKVDERTAAIEFTDVNQRIVLSLIQPKRLATKHDVYGQYLEAFESASTQAERDQALVDLTQWSLTDPVGTGPFKFENADTRRVLLTKFEEHPDAANINFPKAEYVYGPTNQKRWNMLIGGQTDGSATLFMPSNKLNQLPDHVQVARIPRHWGMGIMFNWRNEQYRDERVRKAFAYAINRELVAKNSGAGTNTKLPVSIPCGITGEFSGSVTGEWLKGVADAFERYQPNVERAASLLEEAGYSKRGGVWHDGGGEPLTATLKAPAGFSDWVAGARTIVSQLDQFGVDAQLVTKDTATYWGKDYPNGDFELALQGWANYNRIYPYFHFEWLYSSTDSDEIWKVPETFEVPPLSNPSGAAQTVTPGELVKQLSTQSDETARETVQRLAWVTNQKLPVLPVQEKLAQSFQTTDHWNVPPADSDEMQVYWPTSRLPREGNWTARRQ